MKRLLKIKLLDTEVLSSNDMKKIIAGSSSGISCSSSSMWGVQQCSGGCYGGWTDIYRDGSGYMQFVDHSFSCRPRTKINDSSTLVCECGR